VSNISTVMSIVSFNDTTTWTVNDWIMIQQRLDNTKNFNVKWGYYTDGFGKCRSGYWMGNEKVHKLTSSGQYKLRIEMRSDSVGWVSAEYSYFYLESADNYYKLHLGGFSGDCGGDCMQNHNLMNFSTFDSDHDNVNGTNCAVMWGGGWWYDTCTEWANLNGLYYSSFIWSGLPGSAQYLNVTRMMIKRV